MYPILHHRTLLVLGFFKDYKYKGKEYLHVEYLNCCCDEVFSLVKQTVGLQSLCPGQNAVRTDFRHKPLSVRTHH